MIFKKIPKKLRLVIHEAIEDDVLVFCSPKTGKRLKKYQLKGRRVNKSNDFLVKKYGKNNFYRDIIVDPEKK